MMTQRRIALLITVITAFTAFSSSAMPNTAADPWFELGEHRAFLLAAQSPAAGEEGKPWVWYAPAFHQKLPEKREQWMIDQLHAKGISVAGIDVGESFGSPKGRAAFQKLYEHMLANGYSDKPVLLARSRGGLMLYNWAVEHPRSVKAIAGIYPVCNLLSYPGLKKAAPAYGLTEEQLREKLAQHNPIDRLEPLAKAKVPLYHLHGDNDKVVPLDQNSEILIQRYLAMQGPATLQVVKDGGHDVKEHWFKSRELTDFMIEQALR